MSDKINTLNDLMKAAAEALENRDTERLEKLMAVSQGWLQDDESRDAQQAMLDVMFCSAEELLSWEED